MTRRRRPLLRVLLALLVVGGLIAWGLRDTSPVGHFTDRAGRDALVARYAEAMTALPPPQRTLDLRTAYGLVRVYRFRGADDTLPPLLLLPGRSSSTPLWADNLPTLLRVRSVYTVDLLGEPGLSIQDAPITVGADQAEWLASVLSQLPERRLHLLGLSIGGWTAVNLAAQQPDLVRSGKVASLTLVEPVLVLANLRAEAVVRSIPASVPWFPKSWRDSFLSWTAGGRPVADDPTAALIEQGMQSYRMALPAPERISEDELRALGLPVLAILAADSPMHDSAAAGETARRTLRRGTLLVYDGASHAISGEHPDRLAADLAAFLRPLD